MEEKNTKNPVFTVRQIVFVGVFAAVFAVLAQISIPTPWNVPITLQTLAAALSGYTIGKKYGTLSTVVYVLIGLIGVPVFAGFTGGVGKIVGVTGGFIWGFIPMVFLCGLGMERKNRIIGLLLGMAGLALCHLCGVIQFAAIKGGGFVSAFMLVSFPYLLKDAISVAAGMFIGEVLRKRVPQLKELC